MNLRGSGGPAMAGLLAALFLFMLAVAAYRLPFLSNVLVGEEGTHAYLVMGPRPVISGDDALFLARLDGKDILLFVDRNVLIYQFLDVVGRGIGQLLPSCGEFAIACVSFHARFPFLVIFLGGLAVAFVGVRRHLAFDRPWVLAAQTLIFLYLCTTPLLVGGSIQPQIDGALGVLIFATAAALLLSVTEHDKLYRTVAAAFIAGMAGALGKNEWAIALAASAGAVIILLPALALIARPEQRDWNSVRRGLALCVSIIAGIAACQALLYLYSPRTFMAGIDVMFRIAGLKLSIMDQIARSWDVVYPVYLASALSLIAIACRLRAYCLTQPALVILAGWAALTVIGYTYSGFSGDGFPRYFCPPAVLASIALVCLIPDFTLPRAAWAAASLLLVLGIAASSVSLWQSYSQRVAITSGRGSSLAATEFRYARLARAYAGIPIFEGAAIAIYYQNIDWIAHDLGIAGARSWLVKLRPNRPPELLEP